MTVIDFLEEHFIALWLLVFFCGMWYAARGAMK
jgi:hypothetical protein